MGLRLTEGIDLARLEAIGGRAPRQKQIETLKDEGLLRRDGDRIAATPSGRLVLERIILELAG